MSGTLSAAGIRPVLLSSSLTAGGSAKAALRLLRGLREIGVEAHLLAPQRATGEPGVVGMFSAAERCLATAVKSSEIALRSVYPRRQDVPFSSAWFGCRIQRRLAALQPSALHLHQCHNGFLSLSALRDYAGPIIWTIHDWWPLTGGCHFPDGCERHRIGCGHCPVLGSRRLRDLSRANYALKSRAWPRNRLSIAAVSHALAHELEGSPLFRDQSIGVVPNGFDTALFRPLPKATARSVLGLPPAARILLFGARRNDANKGFAAVRHLLETVKAKGQGHDTLLVTFGDNAPLSREGLPVPAQSFGLVEDDLKLALLYSAADITLVPSKQESFGLVAAESLACGTPVLAFRTTGLVDIVDHRVNGYLAALNSLADYEAGAEWLWNELEDSARGASMAKSARMKAVTQFDVRIVAKRYVDIYNRQAAAVSSRPVLASGSGVTRV